MARRATVYIRPDLEDDDLATIMGWKEDQVAEFAGATFSRQEIGLAIARRTKANKEKGPL